jgi:DNA-binding transcriptional ArsR family regulator
MPTDALDATFAALADPTRRAILARLAKGEATVTELAMPFAMSQPGVSKHLRVLEHAGLISRRRDAQRRPCRLEVGPLKNALDWLATYREYWEESYHRLDALLVELETGGQGVAGSDVGGLGVAGSGVVGSDVAGSDVAGSDVAGSGVVGSGVVGSDVAGSGVVEGQAR